MSFNLLDLISDSKIATKKENKRKLHKLLDKYGSVEVIERSGELKDGFELDFARVDGALEEVLEERRRGYGEPKSYSNEVLRSNIKSPNSFLPDDEDFSLEGLILNDKQRKVIDKLDMNTQLTVIKALREQQGVEKPKPKKKEQEKSKSESDVSNERVGKANREIKLANNEHSGTKTDAKYSNEQKDDEEEKEIFERVLKRTLKEEGGYEDRKNMIDTPTNMGIEQKTLDTFKSDYPSISQNYPDNVKNLTYNQAKRIAKLVYFDKYRIKEIKHKPLQELMFDSFFNHSPSAPAIWVQRAINKHTNMTVTVDGVMGTETITALNKLSKKDVINVNNAIVDMRLEDHEKEKKTNINPYYRNYTKGLPDRFERFRIK